MPSTSPEARAPALSSFPPGGSAVVVGAGGIGTALAAALAAADAFAAVVHLHRRSDPPVDLIEEETIRAAFARVAADHPAPRLVVAATGFLHGGGFSPEKSLSALSPDHLAHAFAVNATGPALLMKHALPLLPREGKAVFAALSARVGSIGDNRAGGWYAHRASKAALNQLVRTAAIETRRRRPAAVVAALHPGTVDTPLSAPFSKAGLRVRPAGEAAADLLSVIDGLGAADSGAFRAWDGSPIPW